MVYKNMGILHFKDWLEENIKSINLKDIIADRLAVIEAFENFKSGRESRTFGPIEVVQIDLKYQLLDGYHRFIDALIRQQPVISARIIQDNVQPVPINKRFNYFPGMQYKDLENLSDQQLLSNLFQ